MTLKVVIDDITIRLIDKDIPKIVLSNRKQKKSLSFTRDHAFRIALTLLNFANPVPYNIVEGKNGEIRLITPAEMEKDDVKIKSGQTDVTDWSG